MKYYKQTENRTLHILMEVLEEEAKKNPLWTLQGLFALCRDVSLLDDVPENADYFDEIYLTFAELFSEFNRYGRLEDVPETIGKVCSFTTDEAAKNELLSAPGCAPLRNDPGTHQILDCQMGGRRNLAGLAAAH